MKITKKKILIFCLMVIIGFIIGCVFYSLIDSRNVIRTSLVTAIGGAIGGILTWKDKKEKSEKEN